MSKTRDFIAEQLGGEGELKRVRNLVHGSKARHLLTERRDSSIRLYILIKEYLDNRPIVTNT